MPSLMKTDDLDVLVLDEHNGNVSKEWQVFNKTPISIFELPPPEL